MLKHSRNQSSESFWIGWRYLLSTSRSLSNVSRLAFLGLVISVMVLVVVMSVVNGFERELLQRVLGLIPQVRLSYAAPVDDTVAFATTSVQGVAAAAPVFEDNVLLMGSGTVRAATMVGVEPDAYAQVTSFAEYVDPGALEQLQTEKFTVILGAGLAKELGLSVGDRVLLVAPNSGFGPQGYVPRQKRMKLVGLLNSQSLLDSQSVFTHLNTAKALLRQRGPTDVHLRVVDLFDMTRLRQVLAATEGSPRVGTWIERYGPLYQAIAVQKVTMFVLLLFLVSVAAFNLVSGLIMIVEQKRQDVAVLQTLGLESRAVLSIFLLVGTLLAVGGILLGLLLGSALAVSLPALFSWANSAGSGALMSQYFIHYLPVEVRGTDLFLVGGVAWVLATLATIFPAWRATKLLPSRVLAHE